MIEELDCPFDFTSRCTMGRCICKPILAGKKLKTEIMTENQKQLNK
jgi:hypothetical protein